MAIGVALRSDYAGHGKTVTMVSFRRPGVEPKRLVYDAEYRSLPYKSPDESDHPEKLLFAFTLYPKSAAELMLDVAANPGVYNFIGIDNATMFQDELVEYCSTQAGMTKLAETLGCQTKMAGFLRNNYSNSSALFRSYIQVIIKTWLVILRRNDIDVVITTETKNEYINWGSRSRVESEKQKMVGTTYQLGKAWSQILDVFLVLSRIVGDRSAGSAKLTKYPQATMDTISPKCSIPGVQPNFIFKDWDVFWRMVERRDVPSSKDYERVDVPVSVTDQTGGMETITQARISILKYAAQLGLVEKVDRAGADQLRQMADEYGLDIDNALAQYWEFIEWLDMEAGSGQTKES